MEDIPKLRYNAMSLLPLDYIDSIVEQILNGSLGNKGKKKRDIQGRLNDFFTYLNPDDKMNEHDINLIVQKLEMRGFTVSPEDIDRYKQRAKDHSGLKSRVRKRRKTKTKRKRR